MITNVLKQSFAQVLSIADPQQSMPGVLRTIFPKGIQGKCLVVGAGKASALMAQTFERYAQEHWPHAEMNGQVVTRYGHDVAHPIVNRKILVTQAAHPYPDEAGLQASQQMMHLVNQLQVGDICVALISGGGSSLLPMLAGEVTLECLQKLTQVLLKCGAPIEEINVVRKHVSAIQGGRLAQVAARRGARVIALIISDVVGDQACDIASGPCAPDPSTYDDAMAILEKYSLQTDPQLMQVISHIRQGQQGLLEETLKPQDALCQMIENHVFATAQKGLEAASQYCQAQGYEVHLLGDRISGESREFAQAQAQLIKNAVKTSNTKRIAWISGGETTVTIPAGVVGRGGRCSEFLLALLQETMDIPGISALAADTDGIDGSENNAGAFFHEGIRQQCIKEQIDIEQYLKTHDAYGFFAHFEALLHTGPTLTNVNDYRIVLLDPNE